MNNSQLISRRNTERKVDFRPDPDPSSPFAQLRRLSTFMKQEVPGPDDIEGCDAALDALREYTYRKIFTGTTHDEFLHVDATDPAHIDWAIATHLVESDHFQSRKQSR